MVPIRQHNFEYTLAGNDLYILDRFSSRSTWLNNIDTQGIDEAAILAFLESVTKHISYVRVAGLKLGVPNWQLRQHDQSKLSHAEFTYYARQFHGDKGDQPGFAKAWLHHIHANEHHHQHWVFSDGWAPKGSGIEGGAMPMPENYALEMIADWIGAGRAYTGNDDMSAWLITNVSRIHLHSSTAAFVTAELCKLGYKSVMDQCAFKVAA